jgi:large subunit ribosomal protein L28
MSVSGRCDVCGKEPSFGRSVARLGRRALKRRIKARTARMFYPNIQSVRTVVNGTPTRLNVCTSCLKAGKVQRRVQV